MSEINYWSGGLMKQTTRRRMLGNGAALGVGMLAAACGGANSKSSGGASATAPGAGGQARASEPRKGGVLVHVGGDGANGSYDTIGGPLDPQIVGVQAARSFRLMYQGLLGYNPRTYEVQPELAQKWEQVSPTEVVFHLQPGVKWHNKPPVDGRALTADDVVFSLNRMRSKDPRFQNRSLFDNFDAIETIDNATIRVTAKGPDTTILSYLSADSALVLAPEVIQKFEKLVTAESVVGTGAFIMKSAEQGVGAEYVRNPDYWKQGLPYLDGVRTRHFSDQQTAYGAFQSGLLDILLLPGQETKAYIDKQGSGYTPEWFGSFGVGFMAQPNTTAKPMDDARVTRALRLLINHDECITAFAESWNGAGRHGGVFSAGMAGWDFSHEEYANLLEWKKPKDDAAKEAMALLSAAGYSRDNPLSFEVAWADRPFETALSQLLQAQWARLSQGGVKTTIRQYDISTLRTVSASRRFAYIVGTGGASFPEPDTWFNSVYATGGSQNRTGFSDPKFDEMALKQRTILDVPQRKAYVKEMVKYLIDNAPSTMLVNPFSLNGVKPKVHDYAPELFMNGRQYESVWMDA
jgi:peptide/nickel transport system substrate-binding protein